jgi:Secretion system C-terminal sorting domain/Cohesin domain
MRLLIAIFVAFMATPVSSQQFTLFTTSNLPVVGANLDLEVRALNFDSITGISFATTWDSSVFKFVDVAGFDLPNCSLSNNIGATDVAKGILKFNWDDPSTVGVTAKDSIRLFRLRLKVLKIDKNAIINFVSLPPGIYLEVTKNSVKIDDKDIIIRPARPFTTSISDINNIESSSVYPNPISESSRLNLSVKSPMDATFEIYNCIGQLVNIFTKKLQIGNNEMEIFNKIPSNGIYFLNINRSLTLKIVREN